MYPISTFYPSRPIVRDGGDEGGGGVPGPDWSSGGIKYLLTYRSNDRGRKIFGHVGLVIFGLKWVRSL